MLRLSLSITREKYLARCRVISATESFWADGLAHPGDPESVFDLPVYQETLKERLTSPSTQAYKDAIRIARLLAAGNEVVLQIGQTAVHGPELKAALLRFAQKTPQQPPKPGGRKINDPIQPTAEIIEDIADVTLDNQRFVWVKGRTTELPGYIWDTEGVITALVPGYGLVKVGRIRELVKRFDQRRRIWVERWVGRSFWQALNRGLPIPHCRPMQPSDDAIDAIADLVEQQLKSERIQRDREAMRYDPWTTAPDPLFIQWDESVTALEREIEREAQAFLALHEPPKPFTFASAQPVRALGEYVRPVVKTDRHGRRWMLSVEQQRRGYLHGWQRVA